MKIGGKSSLGAVIVALLAQSASAQDVRKGGDLFKRECRACHNVGRAAASKVGPSLQGLFGRSAGIAEGFNYSDAMRDAGVEGLIWSAETLDKYLKNPRAYVPGNKTAFPGIAEASDRKDVIAYLRSVNP